MISAPDESHLLLIGLGNVQRGDDGIGVRLVTALQDRLCHGVAAEIWGDCDTLTIANDLLERSLPALFVDGAEMGGRPGDWRTFDEASVRFRGSRAVSTHGYGFDEALQLARNLGYRNAVRFFTVQPESCAMGERLSATLIDGFPRLLDALSDSVHAFELELTGGQ